MSYTRGKIYSWIGTHEGKDYIAIWSNDSEFQSWHKDCDYQDGVLVDSKIFDEIVAMRWAEIGPKRQKSAINRAIKHFGGNFGCYALKNNSAGDVPSKHNVVRGGYKEVSPNPPPAPKKGGKWGTSTYITKTHRKHD